MTYKNCLKGLLTFIITITLSTLILTILYDNNILNLKTIKILEVITLIISSIISGLYMGLTSKNKGYISGLTLSIVVILLLLILTFIINKKINLINFIIYILIIITTTISSILGINNKK